MLRRSPRFTLMGLALLLLACEPSESTTGEANGADGTGSDAVANTADINASDIAQATDTGSDATADTNPESDGSAGTDTTTGADSDTTSPDVVVPSKPAEAGPSCNPDSPSCGNLQTCTAWEDGKHYCFCPEGRAYQGGLCEGDISNVQSMCAYLEEDCADEGGYCYDVTDSTCEYLTEHGLSHAACEQLDGQKSVAACVSNTTDTTSPWYGSDQCQLVQYWANPTDDAWDCRCTSKFDDRCKRPYNLPAGVSFGDGPRMRDLATTVQAQQGVVIEREWLVPVGWSTFNKKDQTMIFAVNLDTGARRYVSGAYSDPALGYTEVGAGPAFVNVMEMAQGIDGMLYAMGATSEIAPPKVWKVDPTTGDRTLLFDEATADVETLCPNGSQLAGKKTVQLIGEGWAMDEAGNHYFATIGMPGPSIVRFTPDFSECAYLTRIASEAQSSSLKDNVGGGYDVVQFDFRAFEIHTPDGGAPTLYAVSDTKLVAVDLATGNRQLISNAKEVGGLGSGPINAEGLGDRWLQWDPHRNIMWSVGASGGSLAVAVDLTTGDRSTWPCWHPGLGMLPTCGGTGTALIPGYLSYGGFAIDPEPPHHLFFAHDLFAIVRYDPRTGNAYTFSL